MSPKRPDPLDDLDDLLAPDEDGDDYVEVPEPPPTPLDDLALEDEDDLDEEILPEPPGSGDLGEDERDGAAEEDGGAEPAGDLIDWGDGEAEEEAVTWTDEEPISTDLTEDEAEGLSEDDWADLEDERAWLPAGRILVGLKEFITLPELDLVDLVACFDTGAARSTLQGQRDPADPTAAIVGGKRVTGQAVDGALVVHTTLRLGGSRRRLGFRIVPEEGEIPVFLGRDAMEGYFVVDVALRFLHPREAR